MKSKSENPTQPTAGDRRGQSERRTSGDRRRNNEQRTAIVHVTPNMLRMLVVVTRSGGQTPLAVCRSVRWRESAESLHCPEGARELSAAMQQLVSAERLAGARVEVLLSSELCVTRAVTGVAEDVHREAAALRERSQLYLSLGPGKKVIASSSTPLDARHAHTLLTVATEQTLRTVSQAIESAGMDLVAIRAAQVALANMVEHWQQGEKQAVLAIGVDGNKVELGVMAAGRLFLDYRPGGDADVDKLSDLLAQHHTRLERYCQRHHGLESEKLTRLVISGPAAAADQALASIRRIKGFEARLLDPTLRSLPWEVRGEPLAPELAAAVGNALALDLPENRRGPNLMANLVSNVRPPIARLLVRKMAPLAATLLIAVVFQLLNLRAAHHVRGMQAELQLYAPKAARASQLRLDLLSGAKEIHQLDSLASRIEQVPYALLVKNLIQSIPGEVWLSSVSFVGDQSVVLAGSSYVESSIYDLVGHLQHLPGVGHVALQGTGVSRTASRDATTFDIHFDLDLDGEDEQTEETL